MCHTNENRYFETHPLRQRILAMLLVAVVILTAAAAIWNLTGFNDTLQARTRRYVQDVAGRLAADLDNRLAARADGLRLLAAELPVEQGKYAVGEALQPLHAKAQTMDFDGLVLALQDGTVFSTLGTLPDVAQLAGIRESLEGTRGASVLEGQGLLYTIPLYADGRVLAAFGGLRSQAGLRRLVDIGAFDGQGLCCVVDREGKVIVAPHEVEPFLQLDDLFKPENRTENVDEMIANVCGGKRGVLSFVAADGHETVLSYEPLSTFGWVLLTLVPANIIAGEVDGYIARAIAVTGMVLVVLLLCLIALSYTQRKYNARLQQAAFVDPVTGGRNGVAFRMQAARLIRNSADSSYFVAMMDIRHFRLINESFGIEAGNATLKYILETLQSHIQKNETVARGDSDSFCLCLRENEQAHFLERMQKLLQEINAFNERREWPYTLTASVGAYQVSQTDMDMTLAEDRARTACCACSQTPELPCVFYDDAFTEQMKTEQALNDSFEQSLHNHDFQVFLQPKVSTDGKRLLGAEALVRWQHPRMGLLAPGSFIPQLEKNGGIMRLDVYMFEQVCALMQRWMQEGRSLCPISVNLSRRHFRTPGFLQQLKCIADAYHVPRGMIELELTEAGFFDEERVQNVRGCIAQMHEMGFLCSLDDFGSGYSSLGLLREFEVDVIKLDRKFFLEIDDPKGRDVVKYLTQLVHELGMDIVAEGIETQKQLDFLSEVHCDTVQGFIFSKPLPVPLFETWAEQYRPAPCPKM